MSAKKDKPAEKAAAEKPEAMVDDKHPFAGPETGPGPLEDPGEANPPRIAPAIVNGREMMFFRHVTQGTEFDAVAGSAAAEQMAADPDLVQIPKLGG